MKISEEFRKVAKGPGIGWFYYSLTPDADEFARQYISTMDYPSTDLKLEEKTLAYLFLAAIAESEGL